VINKSLGISISATIPTLEPPKEKSGGAQQAADLHYDELRRVMTIKAQPLIICQ
jgi:hypothetical protein